MSARKTLHQNSPTSTDRIQRLEGALTSKYWSWAFYGSPEDPRSVLDALTRSLPHIASDSWPSRFEFGGIFVNGRACLNDMRLSFPCKVEYYEPKFDFANADRLFPRLTESSILFLDNDLCVVYKPARLPTMPAKEQRHFSVKADIERLLGCQVHLPSRLDVSVQGLVVMSRSARMHAPLQQAFERRCVTKEYRLLTAARVVPDELHCDGAIGRDTLHPILRKVSQSGASAQTFFCVLSRAQHTLVAAFPTTGRTHQIRVHAEQLGMPIVGDNFYGGIEADYLYLVSYRFAFLHPFTGREVSIEVPQNLAPEWSLPLSRASAI